MMKKDNSFTAFNINLCGSWRFAWSEKPDAPVNSVQAAIQSGSFFYDCTVPGNFELDLFAIGKVLDLFFGMNPVEVSRATEKCHVFYTCCFDAKEISGASFFVFF